MNTLKILGLTTLLLMVSCNQKGKNPDIKVAPQPDSPAIRSSAEPAATGNTAAAAAEKSRDWYGTYEGTVPCADCPGIRSVLTLNENGSFKLEEEYLERKAGNEDQGTYQWDSGNQVITLNGNTSKYKYKVGNQMLTQLDLQGNPIDGPNKNAYILRKK